jgi:hypothetical protein
VFGRARKGLKEGIVFSNPKAEIVPTNNSNLRFEEEYKSYSLGFVLGYRAKQSLYYRSRF